MENEKKFTGPAYEFEAKMPLKQAIPLGLQHVLAFYAGAVIVPDQGLARGAVPYAQRWTGAYKISFGFAERCLVTLPQVGAGELVFQVWLFQFYLADTVLQLFHEMGIAKAGDIEKRRGVVFCKHRFARVKANGRSQYGVNFSGLQCSA